MTDIDAANQSWQFPDMVREGRAALRLPDHIELRDMVRPLERRVRQVRSTLIAIALTGTLPLLGACAFLFDPQATGHDKLVIATVAIVVATILFAVPALIWDMLRFHVPPAWNPLTVALDIPAPLREILDRAAASDGPVYVCNWKPVDRRIFASPVGPLGFSDDAWGLPFGLYPLCPQPIRTQEAMAAELRWMENHSGSFSSGTPVFSLPAPIDFGLVLAASINLAIGWVSGLAALANAACGWPVYDVAVTGIVLLVGLAIGFRITPGDLLNLLDEWIIDRHYRRYRENFAGQTVPSPARTR